MKKNDRVILCLPDPIWLKAKDDPAELAKLDLIIRMAEGAGEEGQAAKEKKNVTVPVVLTGDHHYYARHRVDLSDNDSTLTNCRDYIVCGGGGAFGLGTLHTPDKLLLEKARESAGAAKLKAVFPSREESIKARRGVFKFPLANKAFSAVIASFGMITLWLLTIAWDGQNEPTWIAENMAASGDMAGLISTFSKAISMVLPSAGLSIWILLILAGFGAFGYSGKRSEKHGIFAAITGALHGIIQFLGGLISVWLAAQFLGHLLGGFFDPQTIRIAVAFFAFPIALLICGFIFGAYLFFSHKFEGMHDQEVFSAQGIEGFKSFLRMRIDKDGLTIYPVGLRKSSTKWQTAPGVQEIGLPKRNIFETVWKIKMPLHQSRLFDPVQPLEPHLIENPIVILNGKSAKEADNAA